MVLKLAKLAFVTVGYAIVGVVAGSVTSRPTKDTNGGMEDSSPTTGMIYKLLFGNPLHVYTIFMQPHYPTLL